MPRFRTQVRIHSVLDTPEALYYLVSVPGWNPHRRVLLPVGIFPAQLLQDVETSPGPEECALFLYATVDLAATRGRDLSPEGPFELKKVRFRDATIQDGVFTDLGVDILESVEYPE